MKKICPSWAWNLVHRTEVTVSHAKLRALTLVREGCVQRIITHGRPSRFYLCVHRAREFGDDRQTGENVRSEQHTLPITPLASVLRRMQGSGNTSMETAA